MRRMSASSTRLGLLALVAYLFVATSCSPTLNISLASSAERIPNPSFTIKDPEQPQQPRYDTVEVWDTTDGKEAHQTKLVWKLVADPFGNRKGVAQLTYGKTIDGFKSVIDPVALVAGHRYTIRVVGNGEGYFHFRIDNDGKLDPFS